MTHSEQLSRSDQEYFELRAEAELELAQAAVHPRVVRAHYLLAGLYLDMIHSGPAATQPRSAARAS